MVELTFGRKTVELPYTIHIPDVTEAMFDELVDDEMKADLLDGTLIVQSHPTLQHDDIAGFIRGLGSFYADERELGDMHGPRAVVCLAPGRRVIPDAFFGRRQRRPHGKPIYFEGTPDWVAELLSPGNRDHHLKGKRPAYREAGVEEIWFVDFENEQVIVDRRLGSTYAEEIITNGRLASRVIQGFWIDVSWLWQYPMPPDLDCLKQILGNK